MALRKIATDGDPVLLKVCKPVDRFDARLAQLLDDMKETMYKADGVGLAAPQVTYIMHTLKEAGLVPNADATTLTEAVDAICEAFGVEDRRGEKIGTEDRSAENSGAEDHSAGNIGTEKETDRC